MARSSHLLWLIIEAKATKQEHFVLHMHIGLGLKFSNSSEIIPSLVKYSVTNNSP